MTYFITLQISIMGAIHAQNFTHPFPANTTPEQCQQRVIKDWEPHGQVMHADCQVQLDSAPVLKPRYNISRHDKNKPVLSAIIKK